MKGDSVPRAVVHNVGGLPYLIETPGSRARGASWATSNGFLWLLGGETSSTTLRNDLFAIASRRLIVLPLKIVQFTGVLQNSIVKLSWETADEINFSHFNIQRSVEGNTYENIGVIHEVTDGGHHVYSFTDNSDITKQSDKIYYRLQIVDDDGSYFYSKIVIIKPVFYNQDIRIYPVPAKDRIQVFLNEQQNGLLTFQVYDLKGEMVISKQISVVPGVNLIGLNTTSLTAGCYVIYVRSSTGMKSRTFMKE